MIRFNSKALDIVKTDLLRGVVDVCFSNGYAYRYTNVSRRAIANLMANPNMSLGFWVNHNCVHNPRTNYGARYQIVAV